MRDPARLERKSGFRLTLAVLLGLSLLIAAARWHTFKEPLEFDTTLYAVFGHELLAGRHLYTELWDIKPPAIYATYAAAELLAGYGPREIFLLSVGAAVATLLGVYAAGAALTGAAAPGLWAALFWAVICGDPFLEANQPNTEVFINACVIWAFALMVRTGDRAFGVRRWLAIGALWALAMLYKPVVLVTALILAGIYLAWGPERRRALGQVGVAAAAAAAILLAVGAYFLAAGRFTDFYNIQVINNRFYAGNIWANLLQGFQVNHLFPSPLKVAAPLAVLGAFGLALGLLRQGRRSWVLLLGLVVGTEIAIALPGRFYIHYYQLWLPPVALAAGWTLQELGDLTKRDEGSLAYPWLPRLAGAAALLVLLAFELPLYRLPAEEWSRMKYGDHYLAIQKMGQELGRLLQPDETLYQWGIADGLYFYSQRRPASGVIYHWPVVFGPLAPSLLERMLGELKRSPPEIFITKWERISRPEDKQHPVVAWFLSHYRFYFQRGPFVVYYHPGGKLAARLAAETAAPAR